MGGRIEMIRVKDRGLELTTRKSRKKLDKHTDKHPVMPGLCKKEIPDHVDFGNVVTSKKKFVNVDIEDARIPLRNLEDRKLVKAGKKYFEDKKQEDLKLKRLARTPGTPRKRKEDPKQTMTPTRAAYVMMKQEERSTMTPRKVRHIKKTEERSTHSLHSEKKRSEEAGKKNGKDLMLESLRLGLAQVSSKFGNEDVKMSFSEKLERFGGTRKKVIEGASPPITCKLSGEIKFRNEKLIRLSDQDVSLAVGKIPLATQIVKRTIRIVTANQGTRIGEMVSCEESSCLRLGECQHGGD